MRLTLAFVFLLVLQARADLIPAARLATWTPGTTVGVTGGIPTNRTLGVTVDASTYGNDSTDATAAILTALKDTSEGQYVYLPPGTYKLYSRLLLTNGWNSTIGAVLNVNNKTIRGAGVGQTIIKFTDGDGSHNGFYVGTGVFPRPTTATAITSGGTAGSSSFVVASASGISVGTVIRVQKTGLTFVIDQRTTVTSYTDPKLFSGLFQVTSVSGTTIGVNPALPYDFSTNGEVVIYGPPSIEGFGIEDMTVNGTGTVTTALSMLFFFDAVKDCWVKGVKIINMAGKTAAWNQSIFCEWRKNYATDFVGTGGAGTEGVSLVGDSSWNLIIDSIGVDAGYPAFCVADYFGSAMGNVIAYNFAYDSDTGTSSFAGNSISLNHGPHNVFNLAEGNVADGIMDDGYHGSSSHNTILRNWLTVTDPVATDNLVGLRIDRWANYYNIVGNIVGDTTWGGSKEDFRVGYPNMGNNGSSGTWGPTTPPDYTTQYANQTPGNGHGDGGNRFQEIDLNVADTMIRKLNYSYATGNIPAGESSVETLPQSFLYGSKPDFFGSMAWPPFDPTSPPGTFSGENRIKIPALWRYVNGNEGYLSEGSATVSGTTTVTGTLTLP